MNRGRFGAGKHDPENPECFIVTTADELTEVIKLLQSQLESEHG